MTSRFLQIIDAAGENKKSFDSSMQDLKESLDDSVKGVDVVSDKIFQLGNQKLETTGWLKGSLSYPWVIVCIIIPEILETII